VIENLSEEDIATAHLAREAAMETSAETVLSELRDNVLLVTLNRPQARNALSTTLMAELGRALDRAAEPGIGAVVITGAGPVFCAGADLRDAKGRDPARMLRYHFNPLVLRIAELDKPLVTAINGPAYGAGVALALSGDIRLAGAAATFTPRFVQLGYTPDVGGSYFVNRLLGPGRSLDWFLTGRKVSATEAQSWGLVSEVLPDEDVLTRAVAVAAELAALPGRVAVLTRQLLCAAAGNDLGAQLEAEVRTQLANIASHTVKDAHANTRAGEQQLAEARNLSTA
jgi:2-(1,2-epoxy-1,2-dihydrophenyl)acetyl-CoA isomerase